MLFFSGAIPILKKDRKSIEKIVQLSGYQYDKKQDIFFSHMEPWQKDFGYCKLYDEASVPLGVIVDCEPIYFEFDNKRWLIEFWKGQYCMTTGCEVGIYHTARPDIEIPNIFTGPFFDCAVNEKSVHVAYSLFKNNLLLFKRSNTHWWVTGFIPGAFSEPQELVMDIKITMDSENMLANFIMGLKNAGYADDDILLNDNTVEITFDKAKTSQPYSRTEVTETIMQSTNKRLCDVYNDCTAKYDTAPQKIAALKKDYPELYQRVIQFGKPKKAFDYFKSFNLEKH